MTDSLLDYRKPRRVRRELADWLGCERCRLSKTRRRIALGRGQLPADVAFVGMGPGNVEDMIGAAFVGPSGALLNKAIHLAGGSRLRLYFCNLVACHPTDCARGPNRDPLPDEIASCRELLSTSLSLARARRVVALGDLAKSETRSLCSDAIKLHRPSYVLRSGGSGSVEFRTFVRELVDVFDGLTEGAQ